MVRKCRLGVALVCLLVLGGHAASASEGLTKHHALSLIVPPKHGPELTDFDRGRHRMHPRAGACGNGLWVLMNPNPFPITRAVRHRTLSTTGLMVESPDEPGTAYATIAEWMRPTPRIFPPPLCSLRKAARFNDCKPITRRRRPLLARDAQEGLPQHPPPLFFKNVVRAGEAGGEPGHFPVRRQGQPRAAGSSSATCRSCLKEHFYEVVGANGEPRDVGKSTLEHPPTSGPYRIKEVDAGRSITYERVKDWWAKDLPVGKGQWEPR